MGRTAELCGQCGQELSGEMLAKMRQHSGPWYVLEHVRPFPGVSLERLVRQIRRGVLTRTTVVRGPTTYHQWRFAAETPVLSKFLGCCWACQADVGQTDRVCAVCRADLDAGFSADGAPAIAAAEESRPDELEELSAALSVVPTAARSRAAGRPATLGKVRVSWIVAVLFVLTVAAIFVVVRIRAGATASRGPSSPAAVRKVVVPEESASVGHTRSADQPAQPPATKPSS
jgi:hypothetical protein